MLKYPDSVVVANSTTITVQDIEASMQEVKSELDNGLGTPLTTDVVPSDLVNSTFLSDAASYGRSMLHLGTTAISLPSGRQIGVGTDYIIWHVGIETYYPRVNATGSTSLTKYYPEMCGKYAGGHLGPFEINTMRSGTWATYQTSLLVPTHSPLQGSMWGLDFIPSDVAWVQELSTTVPYMSRQVFMNVPSEMMQWMAQEPSIIEQHPYIADCWTLPGVGQPTVHIPVERATVTSSHIITMDGPIKPEPSSTETTAPRTKAPTSSATPQSTFESASSDVESSLVNGEAAGSDATPRTFDSTSTSAGRSMTQSSPLPQAATFTSDLSSDALDPANSSPAGQSQYSVPESLLGTSVMMKESPSGNAEVLTTAVLDNDRSDSPSDTPSTRSEADSSSNSPNTVNEVTSAPFQAASTTTPDSNAPLTDASTPIQSAAVADESSSDGTTILSPAGGEAVTEQDSSATTAPAATSFEEDNDSAFGAFETQESGQTETTTAIGGETEPVSEITVGSEVTGFTQIGDLSAVVGSQTLSVGGPAATEGGRVLRLTSANEGLGVVIASAVEPSFANIPTQGMATITANGSPYPASRVGSSAFVVGSQIVLPGSAVSVDSNVFSIESGRLVVGSESSARTLAGVGNTATAESGTSVSAPDALDADKSPAESAVIIAGVTVLPDKMTTIGDQSLTLVENNLLVASGTSTSTLVLPPNIPFNGDQRLVIDAQTFTVASVASGGVLIGKISVMPGSAVGVSGRTFSLTGGALVIASEGSASTATLAPASPEPFAVTLGNQVFSAVYEPIATAQSKTLYSDVTTVMVARPTSSASDGPADASQLATTRLDLGAIIMSGLGAAADAFGQETESKARAEQVVETSLDLSSTSDSTSSPSRTELTPKSSPESENSKAETSGPPSASPSSEASSGREMSLGITVVAALMLLTVKIF
ncbi:hypothetical protein KC318_g3556 [Hortaea werneckii]|nr:hypothetical protein KC334_g3721 [Hortaea werneckii]KAI7017038.1 hypothetical protein KC355_g3794 [Hortaea werneckii]KAI7204049.1 hypothetical protein KC324_g976 [Hortaea werneckii]KAI7595132.1 hypothetical protein KC316_g721 [Hortaea werneckii]KAI7671329.1 hypothetical protein KC318_g3556 [Hortaea werneckii]